MTDPRDALSPREREVYALLATGMTNRMIADRLQLAEGTVKIHVGNVLSKTHTSNRTEAAVKYAEEPQ